MIWVSVFRTVGISLCAVGAFARLAYPQVPMRTVALSGSQAPGTDAGVRFTGFTRPDLNDAGETTFIANLQGTGVNPLNDRGVFSDDGGQTTLLVRKGSPAPGPEPGVLFGDMYYAHALGNARTAFEALTTSATHAKGIWSSASGTLAPVLRTGDPAPGAPSGTIFTNLGNLYLNRSGQFTNYCEVGGTVNGYGIWSNRSGGLELVAMQGTPAPGNQGATFLEFGEARINNSGRVAFMGQLSGNARAIYSDAGGSLGMVARTGWQIPGLPSGAKFNAFGSPSLNDAGHTAFCGDISGTGSGSGLWSEGSGSLQLVARSGTPAPGTGPGVNFGIFHGYMSVDPVIGGNGDVAFRGYLGGVGVDSSNNTGIWSGNAGSLRMLARTGAQAPGAPLGTHFTDLAVPAMNAAGQTVFFGDVAGAGTYGWGVWATDPAGRVTAVAYPGMRLEVQPGVFRVVQSAWGALSQTTGQDGMLSGFNSRGELAFGLDFTDYPGGIFVATVPEPTALLLAGFGALAALKRRGAERYRA